MSSDDEKPSKNHQNENEELNEFIKIESESQQHSQQSTERMQKLNQIN